ncbi:putative spermidine synthase [Aspergillus leporis]|uniref:Putative spermidine synthase n=1 Tax=Aspergillus leporis TaxID=41062 RepID=A0A5N5WKA3_9EURO|nr:putative spermidine synthase [Aspergillus leporis]
MDDIIHPTIKDGWFTETSDLWPGQAMALKVDEILHYEKSKQHDILLFKTANYGTVFVLDNVIHCTEYDEIFYHEMITHLAMASLPNSRNVLVIGGGDGGVPREAIKHPSVEETIVHAPKKYLPGMSLVLNHAAVKVHISNELEFLADKHNQFDVILADDLDPSKKMFQKSYFELFNTALREEGIIAAQENMLTPTPIRRHTKPFSPVVEYTYTPPSTYPSGQTGFLICSKNPSQDIKQPLRSWTREEEGRLCCYYNRDVHQVNFIQPNFARRSLA